MKIRVIIIWILRIVAALILLQTLFFKFTAAPESVALFTKLNMEPWGRIGIGTMELIAAILILYPRTTGWGAGLAVGLMAGALYFHFTKLGIKWDGDYTLFTYAVVEFAFASVLFFIYRRQVFHFL